MANEVLTGNRAAERIRSVWLRPSGRGTTARREVTKGLGADHHDVFRTGVFKASAIDRSLTAAHPGVRVIAARPIITITFRPSRPLSVVR